MLAQNGLIVANLYVVLRMVCHPRSRRRHHSYSVLARSPSQLALYYSNHFYREYPGRFWSSWPYVSPCVTCLFFESGRQTNRYMEQYNNYNYYIACVHTVLPAGMAWQ